MGAGCRGRPACSLGVRTDTFGEWVEEWMECSQLSAIADSQPKNTPELRAWGWKGQTVGFLFSILVKTQPPRCALGCQFH